MKRVLKACAFPVALILLFGGHSKVEATTALGFDVSGGVGTSGFDVTGSYDIKPEEQGKPWELSLSYAHQHATVDTESQTDQYTGGVSHTIDENWDSHAELTYWNDSINKIHYVGPTLGFTYTWNEESTPHASPERTGEQEEHPAEKALQENATEPPPPSEILAVSFNADIFIYGTEVTASSTTIQRGRRTIAVPARTTKENTTQFHPNLSIEKPFLDGSITPYLTVGHYFYSTDPSTIENLAGKPRFAASASRLNALVGGFLRNNGEVGIRVALPGEIDASARVGAEESATDGSWATTQGITVTRLFANHLKVKLDWNRSIQSGVSDDIFTGGLTWKF